MTRRMFGTIVIAAIAAASWRVLAHEGHDHKYLGTVTDVTAERVMLKTRDGKDVRVNLARTTKMVRGKESVSIDALTPGTRVVVTAAGAKEPYTAKLIQVGVTSSTGK